MLARFDGECNLIRVARSEFRGSEIERRDWIENAAAGMAGAVRNRRNRSGAFFIAKWGCDPQSLGDGGPGGTLSLPAEVERERRAKIVAAEGEYQAAVKLGETADIITAHPVALQFHTLEAMALMSKDAALK
jgi:hypothetical protein